MTQASWGIAPGTLKKCEYDKEHMIQNLETLMDDGTAHITRVIPVPETLSPEAQAFLATGATWAPEAGSADQKRLIEQAVSMYPVTIEDRTIAGVPTKVISPPRVSDDKQNYVLINLHGGGFVSDSGSMLESIPIASLTGIPVITVYYRMAPEHIFVAAVEDVIAVYQDALKTHPPQHIIFYGTSAGALLSAQTLVRLRQLDLPMPAALGFFTGMADFARAGDSTAFFGVPGLAGARIPQRGGDGIGLSYVIGNRDPRDPAASPIYADLTHFPPTLCITGTRDLLLSGTANFHRALLQAGVDAELVVFDAMPHAHWYMVGIPEAQEALELMANYFVKQLKLSK